MKKLLALALILGCGLAQANPYHHRHHGYAHVPRVVHHHYGWERVVVPLVIGGVVGAAIANNRAEAQTPPPVIYQSPVVIPSTNNCQMIRETVHPNGSITREFQCHGVQ